MSVQCIISTGDVPLTVAWTLNGEPIVSSNEITISKNSQRISTLVIESVSDKHVGNYTCIGRNDAGINSHTAELKVNG